MKGSEMAEVRQQCSNDRSLHSTAGFAGRESTAFAFQIDCTRDVASRRRSTRDNTSDNIGSDIKVLGAVNGDTPSLSNPSIASYAGIT
jgi:hypothetical protein